MSDVPKAADFKRGWPRRCVDLDGLRVRLRRGMRNGMAEIPEGTFATIEYATGWNLIHLTGDECPCCNVKFRISRVSWRDLQPVLEYDL